jgi:hypothetical protein
MSQNRKLLVLICLSILTISGRSIVNAQTLTRADSVKTTYQTTPFNLVVLARCGYFQQQGIPSYLALSNAYILGRVTSSDLVQAAVQANRISNKYLSDRSFLKAVAAQLEILAKVY